jgi:hypothetical protein
LGDDQQKGDQQRGRKSDQRRGHIVRQLMHAGGLR